MESVSGNSNCIFCNIISGQIPSQKVFEDENLFAFRDINPVSPEHILIIPKIHKTNLNEFNSKDSNLLGELLLRAAKLAQDLGFSESGYRTVINTAVDGGQTVDHLHLHLLGGRKHLWPPG